MSSAANRQGIVHCPESGHPETWLSVIVVCTIFVPIYCLTKIIYCVMKTSEFKIINHTINSARWQCCEWSTSVFIFAPNDLGRFSQGFLRLEEKLSGQNQTAFFR